MSESFQAESPVLTDPQRQELSELVESANQKLFEAGAKSAEQSFGLGCLVAFLTLSVSVALTLLVPVVANGYLKREETIPYIAGANITTLADTLVAAILLGNAVAVRVVLAEAIGVAIVTVLLLALAYPQIQAGAITWAKFVLRRRRHGGHKAHQRDHP